MRIARSFHEARAAWADCSAPASAADRARLRLPGHGIGCRNVYLVLPTREGDRVGLMVPSRVMSRSSIENDGSGRLPAGMTRALAASASRSIAAYSGLDWRAYASSDSTVAPGGWALARRAASASMVASSGTSPRRDG